MKPINQLWGALHTETGQTLGVGGGGGGWRRAFLHHETKTGHFLQLAVCIQMSGVGGA